MPNSKQIALALVLALALSCLAHAAEPGTVTLAWDPNPAEENIAGYTIYYGTVSRTDPAFIAYDTAIDVGNVTTHNIVLPTKPPTQNHPGGPDGSHPYYFAATAYNLIGLISAYSDEISIPAITNPTRATIVVYLTWPDIDDDGDVDGYDLAKFIQAYSIFATPQEN
jgi:hypothetical protein